MIFSRQQFIEWIALCSGMKNIVGQLEQGLITGSYNYDQYILLPNSQPKKLYHVFIIVLSLRFSLTLIDTLDTLAVSFLFHYLSPLI